MATAKGTISSVRDELVTINKGTDKEKKVKKFYIKLEGDDKEYSGFGSVPENYTIGNTIEFEYESKTAKYINSEGEEITRTYHNITKKTAQNTPKQANNDLSEVIKALTMPKISVGYERTKQISQYEPKKVSVYVTMTAENLDQQRIDSMIMIAKTAVEQELEAKTADFKGSIPENFGKEQKLEGPSEIDKAFGEAE